MIECFFLSPDFKSREHPNRIELGSVERRSIGRSHPLDRVSQPAHYLESIDFWSIILPILDAGFADAVREDMSDWFVEILNMEIEKLRSMKDEFLEHHSMQDYLDLENGWLDKVQRVQSGVQSVSLHPNCLSFK